MKSSASNKVESYLCIPLAGGIRCGSVALQGKRDFLKVSVPGSYLTLEKEDVETLKGILPDVIFRRDKGWIQRSPMTKKDLRALVSDEGGLSLDDLDEDEREEIAKSASPNAWLEHPKDDDTRNLEYLDEKELEDALVAFFEKFSRYGHPFEFSMDLADMLDSLIEKRPDGFWWPWEAKAEGMEPQPESTDLEVLRAYHSRFAAAMREASKKRDADIEATLRRALARADAPALEVSVSSYSGDPDGWMVYVKAGAFELSEEKQAE